ncbi:MAG: hypothetical protein R2864_13150 [Syntrophotaleaceae bacterium]
MVGAGLGQLIGSDTEATLIGAGIGAALGEHRRRFLR